MDGILKGKNILTIPSCEAILKSVRVKTNKKDGRNFMIRMLNIGDINLSDGTPKICAPVAGTSLEEILWEVRALKEKPVDIIEWRIDFYNEDILHSLGKLREEAGETPILATFRTKAEGGHRNTNSYEQTMEAIIRSGNAGLVDIELCQGDETVKRLTELAKKKNVISVVSAHFFEHTPGREELLALFRRMEAVGADLPKVAAMPQTFADVLTLLGAAAETKEENYPIVAISMGKLGRISRLCGCETGSALTFAAGKIASAPGQMKPELIDAVQKSK